MNGPAVSAIRFTSCLLLLVLGLLDTGVPRAIAQPVRPAALLGEAAELERDASELKEAGRIEEARNLMRRVDDLHEQARRLRAEMEDNQDEPRGPQAEGQSRPQPEPGAQRMNRDELERRAHHLEVAIENLHAAGLHEPAERLAEQLRHMRERLAQMTQDRPPRPEVPGEIIEELRNEVKELRQNLRQLRAELEELRHERR